MDDATIDYWEIALTEILGDAGVHMKLPPGVTTRDLAKQLARAASAEHSYRAPVYSQKPGPTDYERGKADGRAEALREININLGWTLEARETASGIRVGVSDEAHHMGYTSMKVTL